MLQLRICFLSFFCGEFYWPQGQKIFGGSTYVCIFCGYYGNCMSSLLGEDGGRMGRGPELEESMASF